MLAHHRRPGGAAGAWRPEAGGVPGGPPRGGEARPRGLEARSAAQALRAAGAQDLRRPRLVGRAVAGGHGARGRHRQDAHGVGPLRAGVREEARGAPLRGVLARDAPEARPRRREARPGGRAHRQGPPARHRRARVSPARRGRGEAALPGLRRRLRDVVGGDRHEPGAQQVGGRCSGTTGWPPPRSTASSAAGGSSSSAASPTASAMPPCVRASRSKGVRASDAQAAQFPMLYLLKSS